MTPAGAVGLYKGLLVILGWLGLIVLTLVVSVLLFQDAVAFQLGLRMLTS